MVDGAEEERNGNDEDELCWILKTYWGHGLCDGTRRCMARIGKLCSFELELL